MSALQMLLEKVLAPVKL